MFCIIIVIVNSFALKEAFETDENESAEDAISNVDYDLNSTEPLSNLKKMINSENFSNIINTRVAATVGDVIIRILFYGIVYSLPQIAIVSLFQLINSIFMTDILPDTSY